MEMKQNITVLPPDDPNKLRLGWVVHELILLNADGKWKVGRSSDGEFILIGERDTLAKLEEVIDAYYKEVMSPECYAERLKRKEKAKIEAELAKKQPPCLHYDSGII